MDQAPEFPLALRLDGDDEPPVPDGDDRFLENLGILGAFDDAVQLFPDRQLGLADFPPDGAQFRRGGILKFLLIEDAAVNLLLQGPVGDQGIKEVVGGGRFLDRKSVV